jgi:hypothetical protein
MIKAIEALTSMRDSRKRQIDLWETNVKSLTQEADEYIAKIKSSKDYIKDIEEALEVLK